jgi:hypothetical protein
VGSVFEARLCAESRLDSALVGLEDSAPSTQLADLPGPSPMLFAYETDERSLIAFKNADEAIAYAEGIDVEQGVWLFFAEDGSPMQPVFTTPNQKGWFSVVSGTYTLRAANDPRMNRLESIFGNVTSVTGLLASIQEVKQVLAKCSDDCGSFSPTQGTGEQGHRP